MFPSFTESASFQEASFEHLISVYELEQNMPVKLAYKLSHKVLCPGPIERQSVQLTTAVFHDSTIQALRYYSSQNHPEFSSTANFLSIILGWFKIINAKSPFLRSPHRDHQRDGISVENLTEKTSYLRGFVDWLTEWEAQQPDNGLSRETFKASRHSSETIASICEFLLMEKKLKYFLPIKFQNDKLEGKFGKIRQMSGGNLFASVRQFLESERTLHMLKLAKLDLSMVDIKDMFSNAEKIRLAKVNEKVEKIISSLMSEPEDIQLVPNIPSSDREALLYVSGCFSRKISQTRGCSGCSELLIETNSSGAEASPSYIQQVNRGGLTYPSELSFLSCAQAWDFYSKIISEPSLKEQLHATDVTARKVFDSSDDTRLFFVDQKCKHGHKFALCAESFAFKCFNIFSKNFVSELNSQIHCQKKCIKEGETKRNPTDLKIKKLISTK